MRNYIELSAQNDRMQELIKDLHKGQMYGDKPYTYHLYQVENKTAELFAEDNVDIESLVYNYLLSTVALGHDLIEDTDITCGDLGDLGFDYQIITAINFLTKKDSMSRNEYIKALSLNELAWKVKVADTYCNLEESMKIQDTKRIRKYSSQLERLYKLKSD